MKGAGDALASVNAVLNGLSACALFAGYWAIRRRNFALHWKLMAAAFTASTLFLAGYLTRFALTGVHRFPIDGPLRTAYLVLLGSHTILALVALPLVLRTMWLSAVRKSFERHRSIAVWTFPVWAYVSVTGVLVYVMLYQLPRWLA
jgi:putative membrane protein